MVNIRHYSRLQLCIMVTLPSRSHVNSYLSCILVKVNALPWCIVSSSFISDVWIPSCGNFMCCDIGAGSSFWIVHFFSALIINFKWCPSSSSKYTTPFFDHGCAKSLHLNPATLIMIFSFSAQSFAD